MKKPEPGPSLPKVVDDCHALLLWMIPALDKFPRNRRFTLGEKIETGLLDVLGHCVSATYSCSELHLSATRTEFIAISRPH